MYPPPDPNGNGAPSPDVAPSQKNKSALPSNHTSSEAVSELQARSLRRRFALAHYLAVTVAQLAWGGLPR